MTVIPQFILKRIYVPGSLRVVPEGMAFDILNSIGPGMLTRLNSIKISDIEFLAHQVLFKLEDKLIRAAEISDSNPAAFMMNQKVTCIIEGATVEPGPHKITVDLTSKDVGKVVISIEDKLIA